MSGFKAVILAGTALTSFAATSAHAQQADADSADAVGNQVAEIIVTAQKRNERLQDVPVAVTAVSGDQLRASNVDNVMDLNLVAPSLNSTAANGIYLANQIRGVGSLAYGAGVESPVGLYVDNVYQAAPFAFSTQLNNVASVEVLKGPQGTLFGRNATGGLINIKTATPGGAPTGKISASYGNYGIVQADAYLGAGLSDGVAADIAFSGKLQGDGFGHNPTTKQDWDKLGRNLAVRSKWVFTPGSNTTVTLIGDYFEGDGTSGGGIAWPGKFSGYDGRVAPDLGYGTDSNVQMVRRVHGGGASLQLQQDFGSVTFNSISAWRTSKYKLVQDIDFSPQPYAFIDYLQGDRQFSQEFQLSSTNASRLKWTLGLFYFDSKSDVDFGVDLTGFVFVQGRFNYRDTVATKSYAAYGQATYEVADATNLTVGLRYTDEKRTESKASLDAVFGPFVFPTIYPNRESTEDKLTYRVSLDHRFSDAVMVYASVNTGFKSGGYNSTAPGEAPYLAEQLTAYEAGLKTDLLGKRLRANLAGFYYDYKNIQVQKLFNNSLFIVNGPAAKIYGLDADVTAVLADGLTFTGGVSWVDPHFKQFPNCPQATAAGGTPLVTTGTSCSGRQLPFASKFNFSGALNYSADVGDGKLEVGANMYYNSGFFFEPDNILAQKRYALVGASATYTLASGISLGIFGRNLTDQRVKSSANNQANGTASLTYQEPRTYGVTVGFKF